MSSFAPSQEQYEKFSEKIFNSTNFAILTSLGLHALLFGGIYLDSSKSAAPGTGNNLDERYLNNVGIVELTPLEQNRLLNFDSNLSPTVTTAPSTDNALPLPSLDSLSAYNYPPVPSLPSLPSVPSARVYPPPIASFAPQPYAYRPNLPLPTPRQLPPPPPNFSPNNNLPTPRRPYFETPRDNLTLEEMLKAPQRASEDLREQLRQGRVNPPLAANPSNATPELEQDLAADSRNTTDREGNDNYQRWLLKNPAVIEAMSREKLSQPEEMSIAGNYPRRACATQISGTAFYAVTVNPQGGVSNPELIKSAGYPILDSQAQIDISSRFFPNSSGQIKPYRVAVSYKPSPAVCPPAPKVNNPPVNTRLTPPAPAPSVPVTPVKPQPVEKPVITPPEAETSPITPPQPEIPVEQTVKPQVPVSSPTPTLPPPEVTPPAPPVSRQPENVAPPQAIEPPAPPSSKKEEAPNPETPIDLEN